MPNTGRLRKEAATGLLVSRVGFMKGKQRQATRLCGEMEEVPCPRLLSSPAFADRQYQALSQVLKMQKKQNYTICALWSEQSGGMKGTNEQRYKCKIAARLRLPDFTNRIMGRPAKFEFQIKTTVFGCIAQILHVRLSTCLSEIFSITSVTVNIAKVKI